jgi:1-acyl-sn-glycerol-3-phosphate acyltransferase
LHNRVWVRAKGIENLPREEGFLYAGNHTSWWDPIVLQLTTPRPVNWLAKKEMMGNAFNRWFFFDKGGCIPVDRNARNPEAFTAAAQALRDGRIIGIFPESTRHMGALGPFKTGVARLALEANAPIVPAALATDTFWPIGHKLPRLGQRVYLNVGTPIRLQGDPHDAKVVHDGTERVRAAIEVLLAEARAARDAKAKWATPG